jgi:FkbM family methyltransferase
MSEAMTMISYAQNHEDVLLQRLFPHDYKGFYVDVGANHPVGCSITKHFYDHGWSGINVEPGQIIECLRSERVRDVNLNLALSDYSGTARFYEYPSRPSDSTLLATIAQENTRFGAPCVVREVQVMTLADLCATYVGNRVIDFLSIDVEGHEAKVIAGGDWQRWRPRVLVIEATRPHTPHESDLCWETTLVISGYRFALFDGLNRYYVRREDSHLMDLLKSPVCVFDDFIAYRHLLAIEAARAAAIQQAHPDTPGARIRRRFKVFRNDVGAYFTRLTGYLKSTSHRHQPPSRATV